jgi:hypothetical protein
MVRMREWLDEHKSEPVRFIYNQYGDTLTVAVGQRGAGIRESLLRSGSSLVNIGEISSVPEGARTADNGAGVLVALDGRGNLYCR